MELVGTIIFVTTKINFSEILKYNTIVIRVPLVTTNIIIIIFYIFMTIYCYCYYILLLIVKIICHIKT